LTEPHLAVLSRRLNELGFAVLRADLFGHGNSGGSFREHTIPQWVSNIEALMDHGMIRNVKGSTFLETKPYGGVEQDDFLNAALALETLLSPKELLELLHDIERDAGRTREVHWGPRTLDMDILFYDKLVYEDEELILPHIDLQNREFVLKPMCELAPFLRHPVLGKTMQELLDELKWRDYQKI
ncbi:MAG: 2-amino-4-hydroxy-6-hydroxymethyldihydropteridine diphosphokinase, partial [Lachnospiraceae bacterium]|nr:2-amino-4-hydroxy-6-hydroxymethyldihydropteridine diphosphokinase [Lachnospiraceae bacterium]